MASTSGCMQQLGKVKVSDPGCAMGESSVVSEVLTVREKESEDGSSSCELFVSVGCESKIGRMEKSLGECGESSVEEVIEQSKRHWSLLADPLESGEVGEGVVAEVDNVEAFKDLQMHPTWGQFFRTFGHDVGGRFGSKGELVVGEKFAEGGQAELYHAQVTWKNPRKQMKDLEKGYEWVVKVFKEGTYLRQLCKQLPLEYLKFRGEHWENWSSSSPKQYPRYHCDVYRGILLKNGRFAFLMKREDFDLRTLIECNLKLRSSEDCGPFSHDDAEWLMYDVARGLKWLHEHEIVHRDLKASNVLVHERESSQRKWRCYIADYECSVGVVGIGFFRAPEILQAWRDQQVCQRPEVFSKAADVYSYGMTCYEILTGKLPFESHALYEYDIVLHGQQLVLPEYIDEWTRALLSGCWQFNPLDRPTIEDIVNSFVDHSSKIRKCVEKSRLYWARRNQVC